MTDYARLAATAARLIAASGRNLTLRRHGTGAYDPATGEAASDPQDVTVRGVVTNYRRHEIDGQRVCAGDQRVLLGAASAPAVGDAIVDGAVLLRVVAVQKIMPGDTALLYDVQARR